MRMSKSKLKKFTKDFMADSEDREEVLIKVGLRDAALEVFKATEEYTHVSLAAGRRFGKTMLVIIKILALSEKKNLSIGYLAPSLNQAKEIFWYEFLSYCTPSMIRKKSESALTIVFKSGTKLSLYSIENAERIRGKKFDYFCVDEAASMTADIWNKIIFPTFASVKNPGSLVIGTVDGRGWFYDHCHQDSIDHKHFHFTTIDGGWVSPEAIAAARRQLTKSEFNQEFLADWNSGTGNLVYPSFSDKNIVPASKYPFNPSKPINITFDFNIDPLTACIIQPIDSECYVICKEFFLHSANTIDIALEIKEWLYEQGVSDINPIHNQGNLTLYADYAGNQRKTSGVSGTDIQILQREFKNFPGYKKKMKPTVSIKDRTSSVDVLLENAAGERRLFVSDECKHVIYDFRKLEWKKNSNFQLSTKLPEVGHISDAISYMFHIEVPTHKKKKTSKVW